MLTKTHCAQNDILSTRNSLSVYHYVYQSSIKKDHHSVIHVSIGSDIQRSIYTGALCSVIIV